VVARFVIHQRDEEADFDPAVLPSRLYQVSFGTGALGARAHVLETRPGGHHRVLHQFDRVLRRLRDNDSELAPFPYVLASRGWVVVALSGVTDCEDTCDATGGTLQVGRPHGRARTIAHCTAHGEIPEPWLEGDRLSFPACSGDAFKIVDLRHPERPARTIGANGRLVAFAGRFYATDTTSALRVFKDRADHPVITIAHGSERQGSVALAADGTVTAIVRQLRSPAANAA
jgi:hypothetical protein